MSEPKKDLLVRFTIDAVIAAEDLPSEHRLESLAEEMSDTFHISIAEPEDGLNLRVEKYTNVHIHDTTESRCRACMFHASDDKNGDSVVAESAEMAG